MNHLAPYQEHKAKRGRPRKEGPRYECGKRVPELSEKEKQVNMATASAARMRHNGLTKPQDAQSPFYGYALGRLHLKGLLHPVEGESARLVQAGDTMGEEYDRWYRLTGIPSPNPKAMDMRRVRGIGGDPSVDDAKKAANRMMAIEQVLGSVDRDGRPVMSLCKRIILRDEDASQWTPSMIGFLKRGLRALADHYGLEKVA